MKDSLNIVRIRAVANTIRELNQTVVFVGGATVSLYAGKAAPEARPTDDVDEIVELASYGEYAHLEDRLRSVGFVNDTESGVSLFIDKRYIKVQTIAELKFQQT